MDVKKEEIDIDNIESSDDLYDTILTLIDKNTITKDDEGNELPYYCFIDVIIDALKDDEVNEDTILDVAKENDYLIYETSLGDEEPLEPEDVWCGKIICKNGCDKQTIIDDYESFYGFTPTIEEIETDGLEKIEEKKENELTKRAKKNKKTDKKGAKGWFVNLNAGDVEHNVATFNHAMGSDGGGDACAMGESLDEEFNEDEFIGRVSTYQWGGNYFKDVFTNEDIKFMNSKLKTTNEPFFRIQDKNLVKNLKVGDTIVFDEHRSFSKNEGGLTEVITNFTMNTNDEYDIFKTSGYITYFDASEYEYDENFKYQEEAFVSGIFKVIEISEYIDEMWEEPHKMFIIKKVGDISNEKSLDETIEKHEELNPLLWTDEELNEEVKEKVQDIADNFKAMLEDNEVDIDIKDVVLLGSNASYNYSDDSDLDIHIIADTSNLDMSSEVTQSLYDAYKSLFNSKYEIEFYGIPVEIYVELDEVNAKSNGIYSIYNGWIKKPNIDDIPNVNDEIDIKDWRLRIRDLLEEPSLEEIDDILFEIYQLRKGSIGDKGEYSEGNLTFKEIRNQGLLKELKEMKVLLETQEMSL